MKEVDSDALSIVDLALGLSGPGTTITELTDGVVDQSLDVVPIVRRGRTQARTDGIYTAVLQNAHSGAGTLSSQINPYNVGFGAELPPYAVPTPRQFDIWLLNASLRRLSGASSITGGLFVRYSAASQGWGISDTNVPVALLSQMPAIIWTTLTATGIEVIGGSGSQDMNLRVPLRLPRDPDLTLLFESTATALSVFVVDLILGVFPVALGQDVRI